MWGTRSARFSLLLLEEGEQYLNDWTASASWPQGFLKATTSVAEPGRLRLCSKSIFFEPDQIKLPIVRIPFTHVQELEFTDQKCFRIVSTMLSTMRPNNLDVPYGYHKGQPVLWKFSLPYAPLEDFMLQAQRQLALSHLPRAEREDLLQAEKFTQADATGFDTSRLVDFSEEITCDSAAVLLSPLTTSPGRLIVTPQRLYFQPKHDITGQMPCHSHPLPLIAALARRRAILRPTGLEIFFVDPNTSGAVEGPFWEVPSAFFAFASQAARDQVLDVLKQQPVLASGVPGGPQAAQACPYILEPKTDWLPRVMSAWQAGRISNFAYLLYLNFAAGRSLNDLAQWPVFPWVLCDYRRSQLDLSDPTMFRDLSKPIGALNPKRLAMLTQRFQEMPSDPGCDPPFMYGTHYSCPGYVMFWMVRAAPGHLLRLQTGRFDSPDRMFCDLAEAWDSVMSNPTDVKELIPEFFLNDTRFLQNLDALPLGTRQNGRPVGDVKLPAWARSPSDFLSKHKAALESLHVSARLHEWIDLIFGCKQKGPAAVEAGNVFRHLTYEGAVDVNSIADALERQAIEAQINEFGQCPAQLFQMPHPRSQAASPSAGSPSGIPEQDAHQTLSSAFINTILAAADTMPEPASQPRVPAALPIPVQETSDPAPQPPTRDAVSGALSPERSSGSWTSKVDSARRWSGQLGGQLGTFMDGIAQKGQQAGMSRDVLKGMFKRPAAQQPSQASSRLSQQPAQAEKPSHPTRRPASRRPPTTVSERTHGVPADRGICNRVQRPEVEALAGAARRAEAVDLGVVVLLMEAAWEGAGSAAAEDLAGNRSPWAGTHPSFWGRDGGRAGGGRGGERGRFAGRGDRGGFGGGRGGPGPGGGRGPQLNPQNRTAQLGTAAQPGQVVSLPPTNAARTKVTQDVATYPPSAQAIARAPRPKRPSFGRAGTAIKVTANHFQVSCRLMEAYHYDVAITQSRRDGAPAASDAKPLPARVCRLVMSALADQQQRQKLWRASDAWAFDGRKNIYTPKRWLPQDQEFQVDMQEPDAARARTFHIRIKYAAAVNPRELVQFAEGRAGGAEIPQDAVQALDVAFNNGINLRPDCLSVASAFFFENCTKLSLDNVAEAWLGFRQSLRPCQGGLSLNVDIAATAFLKPSHALDYLRDVVGISGFDRELTPMANRKASRALRGIKVITTIPGSGVKRGYRATGLTEQPASEAMFMNEQEKREMSVAEYFQQQYQARLNYPHLPCITAGSRAAPNAVPPAAGPDSPSLRDAIEPVPEVNARILPPPQLVYNKQQRPLAVGTTVGAPRILKALRCS
ncbi:hypothetical protein WJX84_001880 [Apatococcus fuscideae]|uniref:Uncharacterized protein n=1 Tax=Apatococcus fuscideae TaxID=2026836 RepID=A0AAW1TPI2_9CHLO